MKASRRLIDTLTCLALTCLTLMLALPARADDFDQLVAAEKAFAADASARTTRDAFLAALADDGVVFEPWPLAGKTVWAARTGDKSRLEWAPEQAEIAGNGDLGYTIGPWRYTPANADKPLVFGHYLTVWKKQGDGNWRAVIDYGIQHAAVPFPEKVIRRGGVSAGPPPIWPVGLVELRKADLVSAGLLRADMVTVDFLRLRTGLLPDGRAVGDAFDTSQMQRVDTGLVISSAGDMAVTWGGGPGSPSWLRVWRRPLSSDPPGLGWRLAVDMSQAAPKPSE